MKLIFGLFSLAVIAASFFVWRAIARSPKLDRLFNFARRENTAADILAKRSAASQELNARGRTLSERQTSIQREINRINKNK